jgi:type III restriction enzyme
VLRPKDERLNHGENSKAKKQVGELWEKLSDGKAIYLMATAKDETGRDVRAQLLAKIR